MKKYLAFIGCIVLAASCTPDDTPHARHVIMIGCDAMGAFALQRAETPNLNHMIENGAVSINTHSVRPTSSSQNWMSMVSGALPLQHGVLDNDWEPDNIVIDRFAEMVLFKAEALIHMGNGAGAAVELNRLRKRAGLTELTTAKMEDLKKERRCELSGEFTDRFMDLKRWEDYKSLNAYQYAKVPKDPSKPLGDGNPFLADNDPANKAIWPVTENAPLYSERETAQEGRHFEPEYDLVFPFPPQEVTKANGRLKQNPIGK